jgi:hypothetical protein
MKIKNIFVLSRMRKTTLNITPLVLFNCSDLLLYSEILERERERERERELIIRI